MVVSKTSDSLPICSDVNATSIVRTARFGDERSETIIPRQSSAARTTCFNKAAQSERGFSSIRAIKVCTAAVKEFKNPLSYELNCDDHIPWVISTEPNVSIDELNEGESILTVKGISYVARPEHPAVIVRGELRQDADQ